MAAREKNKIPLLLFLSFLKVEGSWEERTAKQMIYVFNEKVPEGKQ